jgi:hypothetical protein
MKRTTRILYAAFLLAAVPVLAHCEDEGPTDVYDFVINNQTTSGLELWVQTTGAFSLSGTLGAMGTVTLQNLQIGVTYNFRLSAVGTGPGTFLYERAQTGTTTATVTWTVP